MKALPGTFLELAAKSPSFPTRIGIVEVTVSGGAFLNKERAN